MPVRDISRDIAAMKLLNAGLVSVDGALDLLGVDEWTPPWWWGASDDAWRELGWPHKWAGWETTRQAVG